MSSEKNEVSLLNIIRQEKKLLKSRDSNLMVLAFGTLITMHMVGGFLGSLIFNHWLMILVTQLTLMFIGYNAIDGSVKNYLSAMSNVAGAFQSKDAMTRIKNSAIMVLGATILFSIISNFFVSDFMVGDSNYKEYNKEVFAAIRRDSSMKVLAMNQLSQVSESAKADLNNARMKAKTIIENAVASGSKQWQKDYQSHKDNRNKWFWKCKTKGSTCPPEYIAYRNRILEAEKEGDSVISFAVNSNKEIKSALTSTISYNVSKDSTITNLYHNVSQMESDRKWRRYMVIGALSCLVLISGFFSYRNTLILLSLRQDHGQNAEEKDSLLEDIITDIIEKITEIVLMIFATIFYKPFEFLKRKKILFSYEFREEPIAKTKTKNYNNNEKTIQAKIPITKQNGSENNRYNDKNDGKRKNKQKRNDYFKEMQITGSEFFFNGKLQTVIIKTDKNDVRYFVHNGIVFIIHKKRKNEEKAFDMAGVKTNLNANSSKLKNEVGVKSSVQSNIDTWLKYLETIKRVSEEYAL